MRRDNDDYTPDYPDWTSVRHYYGDIVRQCFFMGAVLITVGAPFYANDLQGEILYYVAGSLLAVTLAALTNPHSKVVMVINVLAAGGAVLLYQSWALFEYQTSTWVELALREAIALIFLAALYFGLKTLRSMFTGKIGKQDNPREFDTSVKE